MSGVGNHCQRLNIQVVLKISEIFLRKIMSLRRAFCGQETTLNLPFPLKIQYIQSKIQYVSLQAETRFSSVISTIMKIF